MQGKGRHKLTMKHFMMKLLQCLVLALSCATTFAANPGKWQSDTLAAGFYFHQFNGFEEIAGAEEMIRVAEFDLDNPDYKVIFQYCGSYRTTSQAFADAGALATVNATYETASVYIKMDGDVLWAIDNPFVGSTPVPQWKTDCAIALDSAGRVHIEYTGKDKTIAQMRKAYIAMDYPFIFTGSPMLIDDYEPVGKTFAEKGLSKEEISKLNYEDPLKHQHVRHPRSAVALTGDNHLLLIVVDGRRPGLSAGMSACELTTFLEHYFHPRYAMNLDGGGSSTLCVRGLGDPVTNVVNYPSGNRELVREKERKVPTHISVVRAE